MVRFEWHDGKNEANRLKHGIDFATAELVFDDPNHISFIANVADDEERWVAIGLAEAVVVLVVVHTYRESPPDSVIRIISARRATRHERSLYAQANI